MKSKTKAQVSLEFLMTYGWAFLVALVAIGALAYFGVLNPSKYTPARCTFQSEVTCNAYKLERDAAPAGSAYVNLKLTNGIGASVRIKAINVTDDSTAGLSGCTYKINNADFANNEASGDDFEWADGSSIEIAATCIGKGGFVIGEKKRAKIKMLYYDVNSGENYAHPVNGEVYIEVQEHTA